MAGKRSPEVNAKKSKKQSGVTTQNPQVITFQRSTSESSLLVFLHLRHASQHDLRFTVTSYDVCCCEYESSAALASPERSAVQDTLQKVKGNPGASGNTSEPGDVSHEKPAEPPSEILEAQGASADADTQAKNNGSRVVSTVDSNEERFLHSAEDSESLDSDVGSDLLTNVEGADDVSPPPRTMLTGVQIVDDDEAENVGMQNVAKLLRRQRYHDDDISQAAGPARISLSRCFRCLLPGHLARDCPNPAKEKPCHNCAGYGHVANRCPKSMCYRCNGFGHVASECTNSDTITDARVCIRCGKTGCSASGGTDWHRVHRGCRQEYSQADLQHVRCFVCGKQGHFCCKDAPMGHTGLLDICPEPLPKFLRAEGHQARSRREEHRHEDPSRSTRARVGDNRGGNVYDDMGHRYRSGPTRLDTGRTGSGYRVMQDSQHSGRHAPGGAVRAQPNAPAQPAAGPPVAAAAGGNRYGPQRYGYGPVEPQAPVQNPSYGAGRRRRDFHESSPAQYAYAAAPQGYGVPAHPPPDMIPNGGHGAGSVYGTGGNHSRADPAAMRQGGHVVVLQAHQGWQAQEHDIAMQRQQPTGSPRQPHTQHPHAGQAQQSHPGATYYMATSTGQGTYRRWA